MIWGRCLGLGCKFSLRVSHGEGGIADGLLASKKVEAEEKGRHRPQAGAEGEKNKEGGAG